MADYSQIVDEIMQIVLCPQAGTPATAYTELAGRYAEAVKQVNDQLHECDRLLRQGHRPEAIRQAETEPNVLDSAATLDFPEREVWAQLTAHHGLPNPPELLIDIAADLNEAYSAEQKLTNLMRLHRLHALARSPLRARIEGMRKIAQLDRDNPIWEADIREFEKARISQLSQEVELAAKNGDPVSLGALEHELSSQDWLESPPKRLVERTVRLHTQLRARLARAHLEKLQDQLNQAFSHFDVELGRQLRGQWNARAAIANLRQDDPLVELVAPALEWLDQQDREEQDRADYESALAMLEQALDEGVSRGELEQLAHAVARHELGIPEMLERRVAERYRYLDLAVVQRGRMILVSIVLFLLLTAGGIAFGVFYHLRSQEVAMHETNLAALIDNKQYDEAGDYFTDLEHAAPHVFRSPAIQKLRAVWQDAVEVEKERQRRFQENLNAARKAGVEGPTWGSLPLAKQELQKAEKSAASDGERNDVKKVQWQIREAENRMREEADEEFRAKREEFLTRVEPVLTGPAPQLRAIEQLIEEGNALVPQPHVSANLTSSVTALIKRLNAVRDTQVEQMAEADFVGQITQTIGDENAFRTDLERYCQRFPETSRASDFERVTKQEIPLWKGIERWDELIRTRLMRDLTELGPEQAKALIAEITKLREEHKFIPEPEGVKRVLVFLDAATNRIDDSGSRIHLKLNGEAGLNNPTVVDLFMVRDRSGKRYYFRRKANDTGSQWSFYCLTGLDLDDERRVILAESEIANAPKGNSYDWIAPQAQFSTYALDKLARLNDGDWVSTFSDILTQLHANQHMEPILKVQLMQRVLGVACEGSYCLDQALEKQAGILETVDLDANWIDPDDPEGQKASKMAQQVLDRLGDLNQALEEAAKLRESFRKPTFGVYYSSWVGWLTRDPEGGWTCLLREGVPQQLSGDLAVLHVTSEGAPAEFSTVGQVRNGEIQIKSPTGAGLVEGRAVFVAKPYSP